MLLKPDNPTCKRPDKWQEQLTWGDIVAFRFPISQAELISSPEARPCLVCDVTIIADLRLVTLICGLDGEKVQGPYQMTVSSPEAMRAAGLTAPILFEGNLRITVSSRHKGFVPGPDGTLVISRLDGAERQKLKSIRSRILDGIEAAAHRRKVMA